MRSLKFIGILPFVFCLFMSVAGCGSDNSSQKFDDARSAFLEAKEAAEKGDSTKAIEAYTRSLEVTPTVEAYLERAKLYAAAEKQQEALKDCEAARELAPENEDVEWLIAEIKKPAEKRFQGTTANSPSSAK